MIDSMEMTEAQAHLLDHSHHHSQSHHLPSSSSSSDASFLPPAGGAASLKNYDLETKGNLLKYLLGDDYGVSESIILGKVYQVAPWRTGRYIWKSQGSLLFPLKLFSHLLLIVLLSTLLIFMNYQYGSYYRGMATVSCGFFLPKEYCNYDQCVGYLANQATSLDDYSCSIYKRKDLVFSLSENIYNYYHMNETSLSQLIIPKCGNDTSQCVRDLNLENCQPQEDSNVLDPATIKLYKYHDDTPITIPLYEVIDEYEKLYNYSQYFNLSDYINHNFTQLQLIELELPFIDTFVTDNYHANYIWYLYIRYEFQAKVNFQLTFQQKLTKICNIQGHGLNYWKIPPVGQTNSLDLQDISLASLQGGMNILAFMSLILSFVYLLILFYETIQNIRLVCFTSDVLSYNPFLSPSQQQPDTWKTHAVVGDDEKPETMYERWREFLLNGISILLRKVLGLPKRFYLNDYPQLYTILATEFPEDVEEEEEETERQRQSNSTTKGSLAAASASSATNSTKDMKPPQYSTKLSFNEMKSLYKETNEIFRFAPEELYNFPKEKKKSESVLTNIPLQQIPTTSPNKSDTHHNDDQKEDTNDASQNSEQKEQQDQQQSSELADETTTQPSHQTVTPPERQTYGDDASNEEDHETEEMKQAKLKKLQLFQRKQIQKWKHLSFKVKMRLLDGWRIVSVLACLLSIYILITFLDIPRGYYLLTSFDNTNYHRSANYSHNSSFSYYLITLFLGLILFLHYFTLLNYLRYNNRFTTSTIILWSAFFKAQRIIVSILPIAIGLMLLGILVFGNSSAAFGSMSSIFITIYSVMNCDSIWQTFNDTNSSENAQVIGTIYVTIIFIIFSYLMMRLILAVVESLYFYFRLYSNLRRKRLLYRKKHLLVDDQTATTPTLKVRTHTSDAITKSLFAIYTNSLKAGQQQQHVPKS